MSWFVAPRRREVCSEKEDRAKTKWCDHIPAATTLSLITYEYCWNEIDYKCESQIILLIDVVAAIIYNCTRNNREDETTTPHHHQQQEDAVLFIFILFNEQRSPPSLLFKITLYPNHYKSYLSLIITIFKKIRIVWWIGGRGEWRKAMSCLVALAASGETTRGFTPPRDRYERTCSAIIFRIAPIILHNHLS